MAFDTATLTKARASGYSDDEIVSHLSQSDTRFQQARDSGYGLDEIAKHFDPKPVEVKPDTFADDWSGFVANMQIAGNRMLQGVTAYRLNAVAKTQKSAQLARQAVELGTPEAFNAYAQDRIEELGLAAYPKNDPEAISKEADVLERRWRDESLKIPEFANYLSQKEKRIQELTPGLSPEMQKFNEAKGAEFWKTFASNPVESLANVIASSAIVGAPAIAAGAIGSLAGPAGTAAATFGGSYSVESSQSILDALKSADVDISNPEQVEAAFTDPQVMEKARDFANKRGIPIAIFDAATAGIAGKFIGPALKEVATPTTKAVLAATGKEVLTQAAGGAAGEFSAEVAAGQEISAKEIALEALGEIGSGVTEAAGNVRARNKIDSELQRIGSAEPPVAPETPALAPETPPAASSPSQEAPTTPAPVVQQQEPTPVSGERIVSTGILSEEGVKTGPEWKSSHADIIKNNPELALDENVDQRKGFIIQDAQGNQRFVGRKEALEVARRSGQVDESLIRSETAEGLISEALIEPKPITENATPIRIDEGQLPSRGNVDVESQGQGGQDLQQQTSGEPSGATLPQPQIQAEEVANTLQPYFNQAVEAAKKAGATDPESAASQAQVELSQSQTSITNPRALFLEAARRQALKQQEKRGVKQTTPLEEADEPVTETGPRAETISKESASSIQEAIAQMPDNDRRVMEAMMEDPSLSIEELVSQTKLTPDQVKKARQNARQALRKFVKSQGIGERMAPGASNIREIRNARYTLASDIYEGLRSAGQLTRDTWEKNILREYGDIFDQQHLDDAWAVAQEASESFHESKGQKPMSKVIDELTGATTGEGITGIRNKQADIERRKRGLPAAMAAARRTHLAVWDEAMRMMDESPQLQSDTIRKYKDNPDQVPTDTETAILLHAQIEAENRYDQAIDEVNSGPESERLAAWSKAKEAEAALIDLYDLNKQVGTAQGRSLASRRMMAGRDYTLVRMLAEEQASKGGEPLTTEETQRIRKEFDEIQRTQSELRNRLDQLEEEAAQQQADEFIKELSGEAPDPSVKPLIDRILSRLDSAANKARERLKSKLAFVGSSPDPTILYDLSVIGASKIAHGLVKFSRWSKSMIEEFGEGVKPYLKDAFEQANSRVNEAVEGVAPKNEKVKRMVKNMTEQQVIDLMESRMEERIKDGDSLDDLRAYVQRIALALVRGGAVTREPLVDALHSIIEPISPGITKRKVMDLMSGYGDYTEISKEKAKVILRDIQGQSQQIAKLEDIKARVPLSKTGRERRTKSDEERRLEREVNEAKKKYGVVVTDPERQLKSTLDSIKTRLKNEIRDLNHQFETGEKPMPGTPPPTDEQVGKLKAMIKELKNTLKELEGTPQMTDEQRIRMAEKALERSIKSYEEKINSGDTSEVPGPSIQSEKLTSLKAKRDALKAELDAIRSADTDRKNTQAFDRIMKESDELQGRLDRGEVQPETKAARIEDELVTQARDRLQKLRDQMLSARRATPEFQKSQMDAAIEAVQRSIESYDARLKSGDIAVKTGNPKVTSPLLERLRAERDAMRKLVQELRKPENTLSPDEVALKQLKARVARRNAELQDRIARGDFSKKARKEVDASMDSEAVRLLAENERLKREFENRKLENARKQETKLKKALRITKEIFNITRAVKSSFDLSAVLRQGGFIVFGHPIRAVKALKDMFRSFTQKGFEKSEAELKLRPNYSEYKKAGLFLGSMDGALDKREEAFRSELSDKIPGVKLSNRTYISFLNRLRADSYDAMIENLSTSPTIEQKKAIAHFVNTATGRGDLGAHGAAAETLSTVLWSPRLLISRLQILTAESILRGDAKGVRTAIAKEYARTLAGASVVLVLGALAGAEIEKDPRSSDFGKLKFGKTRIDPWMGLQQVTVFLTRMAASVLEGAGFDTPGMKTQRGKIYSLRKKEGEKRGPYDMTTRDVASNFLQSKLTPILGGFFDYTSGENMVGQTAKPFSFRDTFPYLPKAVSPLSFDELIPVMKEQGIPAGTAMQILNLFGMSVQYQDDSR
jgi:hypothetical protein